MTAWNSEDALASRFAPVPKYQILELVKKDGALSRLKVNLPVPPSEQYLALFDQVQRFEMNSVLLWVVVRGTTYSKMVLSILASHSQHSPEEWTSVDLSQL